jgi:hypothetical protein
MSTDCRRSCASELTVRGFHFKGNGPIPDYSSGVALLACKQWESLPRLAPPRESENHRRRCLTCPAWHKNSLDVPERWGKLWTLGKPVAVGRPRKRDWIVQHPGLACGIEMASAIGVSCGLAISSGVDSGRATGNARSGRCTGAWPNRGGRDGSRALASPQAALPPHLGCAALATPWVRRYNAQFP